MRTPDLISFVERNIPYRRISDLGFCDLAKYFLFWTTYSALHYNIILYGICKLIF